MWGNKAAAIGGAGISRSLRVGVIEKGCRYGHWPLLLENGCERADVDAFGFKPTTDFLGDGDRAGAVAMHADGLRLYFYDAAIDRLQRAFAGKPHHTVGNLCRVMQNGTGFPARNELTLRCICTICESFGDNRKARLAGEIEIGALARPISTSEGSIALMPSITACPCFASLAMRL